MAAGVDPHRVDMNGATASQGPRNERADAIPMTCEELDRELQHLHPANFGWALACCSWDRSEADEVLQSSYLKVFDGRARFDGRAALKTWFFGVVRNTAAERRKSRFVRRAALMRWFRASNAPEPEPTPDVVSDRSERLQRVRRAMALLSLRQREVLHLVFYQEMTIEEASRVQKLPVGTARKYYERAKSRMRRLLSEGVS